MERHCSNAKQVADFLNKHNKIDKVIYPSLMDGVHGDRANKYLNGGFGSLLGFELKMGRVLEKNLLIALNYFITLQILGTQGH